MDLKILTVGEVFVELTLNTAVIPSQNTSAYGTDYAFVPGGACGNASLMISRLGVETMLCARVGRDGNAARLRSFYYENNIDTSCLFTETGEQTGMRVTVNDTEYKNKRDLIYGGASLSLKTSDVDRGLEASPEMLFLQYNGDFEITRHAIARANERGTRVFLDYTPVLAEAPLREIGKVDIFCMTSEDVKKLSGDDADNVEKCMKFCIQISQSIKASYYIIRIPGRGVFVYDGKFYNMLVPCDYDATKTKAVFADVFSSAAAAGYLLYRDITKACDVAVICDKLAREDPAVHIPTLAQIRAFIAENKMNVDI